MLSPAVFLLKTCAVNLTYPCKKKSPRVLSYEFLLATFTAILHICVLRSWDYVVRVIDHLVPAYIFDFQSAKA